ncbi:hypothetical protein IAT38_001053 [Cryptococcus sp. DSM 104549]
MSKLNPRHRSLLVEEEYNSEDSDADTVVPVKPMCFLLELPEEILGEIGGYLSLPHLLTFLSLNSVLVNLCSSIYSPVPTVVRRTIREGPPYHHALENLQTTRFFGPPDAVWKKPLMSDIAVQAKPRWIVENSVISADNAFWKEAFERRFLPSWTRFMKRGDSWRAIFIRMLNKIEHHHEGCTHTDAYTRFVTLHRNGSASINRMSARDFNPYFIFDELKRQNNFTMHPTEMREVIRLQDVRIIAIGILTDKPSSFVNPNAHLVLHPPLLRPYSTFLPDSMEPDMEVTSRKPNEKSPAAAGASARQRIWSQDFEDHSDDPSVLYPMTAAELSLIPTSESHSTTRTSVIHMPHFRRASESASSSASASGSQTSPLRSMKRRMSEARVGRAGSSNGLGETGRVELGTGATEGRRRMSFGGMVYRTRSGGGQSSAQGQAQEAGTLTSVPDLPPSPPLQSPPLGSDRSDRSHLRTPSPTPSLPSLPPPSPSLDTFIAPSITSAPYTPFTHPLPAPSYRAYPNFTPPPFPIADWAKVHDTGRHKDDVPMADCRARWKEIEDEEVQPGNVPWQYEGGRMAEWHEEPGKKGVKKRWLGPMMLVAQLCPSWCRTAHPQGSSLDTALEGARVNLGPVGRYVSLDFEDVRALFPWLELQGGGGNDARAMRSGYGFE